MKYIKMLLIIIAMSIFAISCNLDGKNSGSSGSGSSSNFSLEGESGGN